MKCIYCGSETEVTNSRPRTLDSSIWRRRQCKVCVAQFSTNELPEFTRSLAIKGSSGEIYAFSRDKLFLSIYKALGHRKDALSSSTELTSTVISMLIRKNLGKNGLYSNKDLASTCYITIKRFDSLAAHTYKAYHKNAITKSR